MKSKLSPGVFDLLTGIPVLLGMRWAGIAGDVPLWILMPLVAIACLAHDVPIFVLWRRWRPVPWLPFALLSMTVSGVVVIAIGWLAILPAANTGTMAALVRLEGARSWRPMALLSVTQNVIGVLLVAFLGVPSQVAVPQVYGMMGALAALQLMFGHNLVAAARDLERSEQGLQISERRFRTLVQRSFDGILVVDRTATITYASPAMEELMGYSPAELVGEMGLSLVHPEDSALAVDNLGEALDRPEEVFLLNYRLRHRDGTYRRFEVHVRNFLDDSAIGGIVVNLRDVTERWTWEQRLAFEATHDSLTGLPNRAAFLRELGRACEDSVTAGIGLGVLFLDLDGFKAVNDTLGHAVGDGVLCALAGRLKSAIPDASCIARFAGDEFTILLEGVADQAQLLAASARVTAAFVDPLSVDRRRIYIGASVGAAWSGGGVEVEPEVLLRAADADMYHSKRGSEREVVIV